MLNEKESEKFDILVVDNNSLDLDLLCGVLSEAHFQTKTIRAIDGKSAIEKANLLHPQLILLDVIMPEINGFEVCKILKKNPLTADIPVIFMTSVVDMGKKIEAFKIGAYDYITKPFQKDELLARVEVQLQLFNLRKALENKNIQLQYEINKKYESEINLLETNENLSLSNIYLEKEIINHQKTEQKLQAEILERELVEKQVTQSLKEKNLLLKEIHHRVKNNLFIVSSLLDSQIDYVDDPSIIKILENSQGRIMTMALIHEQLHCSIGLCQVDFKEYLINLTDQLINSYSIKNVTLQTSIQELYLNIDMAHPCGLIINEIISNALEHAFPDRSEGNIQLKFYIDDSGNYNLYLKDDGIGFPKDKNFYQSESLGLELVCTLVEQLEGKIEMKNDSGTEIKITFRELNYQSRI